MLRALSTESNSIEFEWIPPSYGLSYDASLGCDSVTMAGLATVSAAGWPALPIFGAHFGLPPDAADVELTVLEVEYLDLPGNHLICPVPEPIWEDGLDGDPVFVGNVWKRDLDAYDTSNYWPATFAALGEIGYMREQRVVQVVLYPFQYMPLTGGLRVVQSIRARLSYSASGQVASAIRVQELDPFELLYSNALVNYEQARAWRGTPSMAQVMPSSEEGDFQAVRFSISRQGMVRVTGADLAALGVPISELSAEAVRLSSQGDEIALSIEQEGHGSLEVDDSLIYLGSPLDSIYTGVSAYWLTWDAGVGSSIVANEAHNVHSTPIPVSFWDTYVAKEDHIYVSTFPYGTSNDRWYWDRPVAFGAPTSRDYTLSLGAPTGDPLSCTLKVYLAGGVSTVPHRTRFLLNNNLLGETTWPAGTNHAYEIQIPQSYLVDGENILSIVYGLNVTSGQYDYTYLHHFELDYARRYVAQNDQLFFSVDQPGEWLVQVEGFSGSQVPDLYNITDPSNPVRITGATFEPGSNGYTLSFGQSITQTERYLALTPDRYLSPTAMELVTLSNWQDPGNAADYIIITHRDFYDAIQPLADYRRAQGLRVVVVDVDEIYNEFNYGIVDAEAIRTFISYAYHNWTPPAPAYVLLVGDGNYDPKNNLGRGEVSYIPPYLADVDPWLGETSADNRYVTVSGQDIFPDLFLGRLPVKTAAETTAMVNKIIAYEALGPEAWQRQITFLADDADDAGDFAALSEAIASGFTPPPYLPERIYYKVTPGYSSSTAVRTALFIAFNQGRLIINWKGHSAVSSWASPVFLNLADMTTINNGYRQPLMVPMTCLEGYYITPSQAGSTDRSSISETLVRMAGRGAIASFAPTGLGIATGHEFLNKGLYEALFYNGVSELGPATTLAKLKLYSSTPGYRELIDTYLLMGDPAMRLQVLKTDVAIEKTIAPQGPLMAGDTVTYTLTYANAGAATAHNVVITDTLPLALENPTVASSGAAISLRPGTRLVWDVANLPEGAGGVITITATISDTFGGALENVAQIATSGLEASSGNNRTQVGADVQIASLTLAKHGPAWVMSGGPITYTLAYGNEGTAAAYGVRITDTLPAGLVDIGVSAPPGTVAAIQGQTYIWQVPDLAPGEGGVITVTATMDGALPGSMSNVAWIGSDSPNSGQLSTEATVHTKVLRPRWLPISLDSQRHHNTMP